MNEVNSNVTLDQALAEDAALDKPVGMKVLTASRAKYARKDENGKAVFDNGDEVSNRLRGKSLEEVYAVTAEALSVTEASLVEKYKHLNAGQQSMTLRALIRGAAKKAAKTAEAA
jgi:hypothetical protein